VEAGILPDEVQTTSLRIDGWLGNDVATAHGLLSAWIDDTSETRLGCRLDVSDGLRRAPGQPLIRGRDHLSMEAVSVDKVKEVEQRTRYRVDDDLVANRLCVHWGWHDCAGLLPCCATVGGTSEE